MDKECSVSWCSRAVRAKGLCPTHYWRMTKGLPLETPIREQCGEFESVVRDLTLDKKTARQVNGLSRRTGVPVISVVRRAVREWCEAAKANEHPSEFLPGLTEAKRDRLIRKSLGMGYSKADVAQALGLSPRTVAKVGKGRKKKTTPKRTEETRTYVSVPVLHRPPPVVSDDSARVQRAIRHWLKNEDLELREVAEMYDVSKSALLEARKRHREAA